jgi:hypothetical protein
MIAGAVFGDVVVNDHEFSGERTMLRSDTTISINLGVLQFLTALVSLLILIGGAMGWVYMQFSSMHEKINTSNSQLAKEIHTQIPTVTGTLLDRLNTVRAELGKEIGDVRDRVLVIETDSRKAIRAANVRTDELARKVAIADLARRAAIAFGPSSAWMTQTVVGTVTSYDIGKKKLVIRDADGVTHSAEVAIPVRTIVLGPQGQFEQTFSFPEPGSAVAAQFRTTASGEKQVITLGRPASESLPLSVETLSRTPSASPSGPSGAPSPPAASPVTRE